MSMLKQFFVYRLSNIEIALSGSLVRHPHSCTLFVISCRSLLVLWEDCKKKSCDLQEEKGN